MEPEHSEMYLRLWADLTRRARPGYVAPAASLLAFAAWQCGNGALANIALERALADDPGYSMARLLRGVLDAAVPPRLARLPMTPQDVAASYADYYRDPAGDDRGEDGRQDAGDDADDAARSTATPTSVTQATTTTTTLTTNRPAGPARTGPARERPMRKRSRDRGDFAAAEG